MFQTEEVEILSNDGSTVISGSLLIPEIKSKIPGLIFVGGSGQIDRDGNHGPNIPFNLYKAISENIAKSGLAVVLKCDKRGVGKSLDKNNPNQFWKAGMFDLVNDVIGQYRFLSSHDSVDPSKIIIIGHSEGAVTLPLIARKIKEIPNLPPLNYGIFLCGFAYTLDECVRYQGELCARDIGQAPGILGLILRKALMGSFTSLDWKQTVTKARDEFVKKTLESKQDFDSSFFGLQKVNTKWSREHLEYGEKVLEV
ncbi:hypothetical protein HK096_009092 [Nowakowskiella sp. JEL0078]|nr:hypothetical protein HK096_009092 [Nowakowskiella sp. JEL0078]